MSADPYKRFLNRDDVTAHKHGGNQESEAAFDRHQRGFTKTQREVAVLYRSIYPQALTPKEVARIMEKPLHAISGRCTEGKQDGWLQTTGDVREGSRALRWVEGAERLPERLSQASEVPTPRQEIERLYERGLLWEAIEVSRQHNIAIRVAFDPITI